MRFITVAICIQLAGSNVALATDRHGALGLRIHEHIEDGEAAIRIIELANNSSFLGSDLDYNDLILALDGFAFSNAEDFSKFILQKSPGEMTEVRFFDASTSDVRIVNVRVMDRNKIDFSNSIYRQQEMNNRTLKTLAKGCSTGTIVASISALIGLAEPLTIGSAMKACFTYSLTKLIYSHIG